jgi:hypothetical protein
MDDWGSIPDRCVDGIFFLFATASRLALWSTRPPIQWVLGVLTPGVKRSERDLTTHLHLVLKSRMCGTVTPLPQYVFMAWCLVTYRDNFTFL